MELDLSPLSLRIEIDPEKKVGLMNENSIQLRRTILIALTVISIFIIIACGTLFFFRSTIAGVFIPQESDFPGMSEELSALAETPYFVSASWIGNPLNEVEIQAVAPESTSAEELRSVQCPMLLEIANLFVSDDYSLEINVSNSTRIPCN